MLVIKNLRVLECGKVWAIVALHFITLILLRIMFVLNEGAVWIQEKNIMNLQSWDVCIKTSQRPMGDRIFFLFLKWLFTSTLPNYNRWFKNGWFSTH